MADELKILIPTGVQEDGSVGKLQKQLDGLKKGVTIPVTLQVSKADQANIQQIASNIQSSVQQAGQRQLREQERQQDRLQRQQEHQQDRQERQQRRQQREQEHQQDRQQRQQDRQLREQERQQDRQDRQQTRQLREQERQQDRQQREQTRQLREQEHQQDRQQRQQDRQDRLQRQADRRQEREQQQQRARFGTALTRTGTLQERYREARPGKQTERTFSGLYKELGQISSGAAGADKNLDTYTAKLRLLEAQLARVNAGQNTFTEGIIQAGQQLASKFLSYEALSRTLGTFYDNLVKVNTAAVDLSVVTGVSGEDLVNYTRQAAANAKDLSLGVADYITGTTMAARLGYNLQDSSKLSEVFNVYDKLAPDVKGVEDASKSIINAMKAYDIGAEGSLSIVDKYIDVGNKFALSSGDIGTSMQRAAASLAASGDSMDESIGLIVGMTEINQDAARTGAALKTLSARLRGSKVELLAAGEGTDGLAESTSKLREQIMALTNLGDGKGGFDIMTKDGQFKSTYEMMKGIAEAYNQMDSGSTNAAALLELIAGKNRASDVAGLLKNFSQAEKAYQTAQESSGVAMKNYDKYQKSLEARSNKTKSIVENLSLNVLDDGRIGTLYDGLNALLEVITKISEITRGIPTIAAAATAAITKFAPGLSMFGTARGLNGETVRTGLFGKVAFGQEGHLFGIANYSKLLTTQLQGQEQEALKLLSTHTGEDLLNQFRIAGVAQGGLFAEVANNLDAVSGSAEDAQRYITTLSASMQRSVKSGGAFSTVLRGIGTTLLNWGASMVAMAVINLVIDGIDQIVNRAKYAQEALDSMTSKFEENSSSLKKSKDLIDQYGERYEELALKVDRKNNRNLGLSDEEYQEYLDIVNALGDSGLNIKIGTDLNGNALISSMNDLGQSMDGLKAAYEQQAADAREEILGGDQMANLAKTELFGHMTGNFNYGKDTSEAGSAVQLAEHLLAAVKEQDSELLLKYANQISSKSLTWLKQLGLDTDDLADGLKSAWSEYEEDLGDAVKFLEDKVVPQLQVALDSQAAQRWSALAPAVEKAQAAIIQGMYKNPELWKHVSKDDRNLIASLPSMVGEDFYYKVDERGIKELLTDAELRDKAQQLSNGFMRHPEAITALTQVSDLMSQWEKGELSYRDIFGKDSNLFWPLRSALEAAIPGLGAALADSLRPKGMQDLIDRAQSHLADGVSAWDLNFQELQFAATQLDLGDSNLSLADIVEKYTEWKKQQEDEAEAFDTAQRQTLSGQWAALEDAKKKADAYADVIGENGLDKEQLGVLDAQERKEIIKRNVLGQLAVDQKEVAKLRRKNSGDILADGTKSLEKYQEQLIAARQEELRLQEEYNEAKATEADNLDQLLVQLKAATLNVESAEQNVITQRMLNLQNAQASGIFQQLTDEGQIAIEQATNLLSLVQGFNASGTIDWTQYAALSEQERSSIFHQDASGYWYADEMAARNLTQKRYQDALNEGQSTYYKLLEEQEEKQAEIEALRKSTDDAEQLRLKNAQEELDILEQQTKAAQLYVDTIKQGAEGKFSFSDVSNYNENGDEFRTNQQAIDALENLWEKGQVYTNKGRAYADYLFGDKAKGWEDWSQAAFEKAIKNVGAYNNDGELDASAFYQAAAKAGLFKDMGNGSFVLAEGVTLEKFRQEVFGGFGSDQYIQDVLNAFSEVSGVVVDLKDGAAVLREVGSVEKETDNNQKAELATIEAGTATINAESVNINGVETGEGANAGENSAGAGKLAMNGTEVAVSVNDAQAQQQLNDLQGEAEQPAEKPVALSPGVFQRASELNKTLAAPIAKTVTLRVQGISAVNSAVGKVGSGLLGLRPGPTAADGGISSGGNTLVGELAPEIIVDRKSGTWRLASFPQLTKLNRGDIVFNGQQTRQILGGQENVAFGKSYAAGTRNFTKIFSDQNGYRRSAGKIPGNNSSNKGGGKGKAFSWDDLLKKWEGLYDWIAKALEVAKKATNKLVDAVADKIGDVLKNKALDEAIASTRDQIDVNNRAYERYMQQANKAKSQMQLSDDIVNRIQNGAIDISEYDDTMKKRIENYKEWYDKATACLDTVEELRKQEKELARQKLDSITDYYEKKADRLEAILDKSSAQLDYKAATGQEVVEADYDKSLSATQKKVDLLIEAREKYDRQFQALVAEGVLREDSDEWHEYIANLEEYDKNIIEAKKDLAELVDTINNIDLTKLQYAYQSMSDLQTLMEAYMSFHSSQGTDATDEQYNELIRNGMDQIQNLQQQNEMLLQQQSGLDVLSEKWQELQDQIISNESEIWSIKAAQEEWNDAIADLRIDRLQQEREELERTNDEYQRRKDLQDAQEEYEKARTQRTKLVYREGVGYTYEADQKALQDAQDKLDDLRHKETLSKIDDAIQAIEDQKKTNNIYDYSGQDIIGAFTNEQGKTLYGLIRDTAAINGMNATGLGHTSEGYQTTGVGGGVTIQIGDIVLQDVQDADTLAQELIQKLPNKVLQAMYRRG